MQTSFAIVAAAFAAVVSAAVPAELLESSLTCFPGFVNCGEKPVQRLPCPKPCDLKPFRCGLGACECPKKCSSLWYNKCSAFGATCRSYEVDCRVNCNAGDFSDAGVKVYGVCVGFSSYKRPGCIQPGADIACSFEVKSLGKTSQVAGNLVSKNGLWQCVYEAPALLAPGQWETCPEGYYPSCFAVKPLDPLLQ